MYRITIKNTRETERFIKDNPKEFHDAIVEGFSKAVLYVESTIKKSFGTLGKPKVRTGHLRRSIYSDVIERGDHIAGIVGSDLVYARIQEEGGVIVAKNALYLRFTIGGRWVSVKQVVIPARPYIEPAIQGSITQIQKIISDTVKVHMERL